MRTRLLSFGVWAVVAGSSLFWGLKLVSAGPVLPAQAQVPQRVAAGGGEWPRLLGASAQDEGDEESPAAAERFRLLGVVAPGAGAAPGQGVALIAVDDRPARAWRTGAALEDDLVLLSVSRRAASLGPRGGPATIELALPEPARGAAGAAPAVARPMPQPAMRAPGLVAGAAPGVPGQAPAGLPGRPGGAAAGAANAAEDDDD